MPQAKDFTLHVRNTVTGQVWEERYQKETDDPQQWGRDTIAFFNRTLRRFEGKRELIRVEVHGEGAPAEAQLDQDYSHDPTAGSRHALRPNAL